MASVSREDKILMLETEIHGIDIEIGVLDHRDIHNLAEIDVLKLERASLLAELSREKGETVVPTDWLDR